jgi:chromosome segregation ATPase
MMLRSGLISVVLLGLAACSTSPSSGDGQLDPVGLVSPVASDSGGAKTLSAFAPMAALQESWTCPVCKKTFVKGSDEEEMRKLEGFYEQIKAHAASCFGKVKEDFQRRIREWRQRQDALNARAEQWSSHATNFKQRVALYETALNRQNQDVAVFKRDQSALNARIERFNGQYGGRKLDPDTYRYASGVKSSLDSETAQMNRRRGDLEMIGTGLSHTRAALENEQGDLEAQRQKIVKEQQGLDAERAELERAMGQ